MEAIDHPLIAEVRRELVYESGRWRHMLIIVTTINLNEFSPDHDSQALNEVVQAVAKAALDEGFGYHALVVRNP